MADTLLILALPSFRSLWLFPISLISFSPNCWSHSWATQDLVQPFTRRVLMNAPKARWMTCAVHGMWFLNAGHSIPAASRVVCSLRLMEEFEEALSVEFPSKQSSVSSEQWKTSFKYPASRAHVCWPFTCHPQWAYEIEKKWAINLFERQLYFSQSPMFIPIIGNDWCYS